MAVVLLNPCIAQTNLERLQPSSQSVKSSLLSISSNSLLTDAQVMDINHDVSREWIQKAETGFTTSMQVTATKPQEFTMQKVNFLEADFEIVTIDGAHQQKIELGTGTHFQAISNTGDALFGNFSLYENQFFGCIFHENGNATSYLPSQNEEADNLCIIRQENMQDYSLNTGGCNTDDIRNYIEHQVENSSRGTQNCKRIPISLRADYDLFLKFNKDTQKLLNYMLSSFNSVYSLYKKENITISIAEIFIHTSKDNFKHLSAQEDLNTFRNGYKIFKGNVHFLLSGYAKNNKAPLGGVAYINTICVKNFAYAYANVLGANNPLPNYSWDILVLTHELGHILGSRHTHACVWGPNKNTALDNCAKVEGSCAPPSNQQKGTIMSYCHLAGQSGIDFNLGFGIEPGNLIRKNVQASTCTPSYYPTQNTVSKQNDYVFANIECHDGIYTHYYFDNFTVDDKDDVLLLSIKTEGQEIGNLADGSLKINLGTTVGYGTEKANRITAPYTKGKPDFYAANKYWDIVSTKKLTKEIGIKYYFTSKDYGDLKGSAPFMSDQQMKMFQILNPGSSNPSTNHANTTSNLYKEFLHSTVAGPGKFTMLITYTNPQNPTEKIYAAEFTSPTLTGGGFGVYYSGKAPLSKPEANGITPESNTLPEQTESRSAAKEYVYLSPNPASAYIHINAVNIFDGNMMVKIYTMKGQIILQENFQNIEQQWNYTVDLKSFEKGMYIIQLQSTKRVMNQTFIVI